MLNHKVKILLVDDEQDALDLMEHLLGKLDQVEVVGKASSRFEAVSLLLTHRPNVIFQDVQMHGESGLDFIDEYRKHYFTGKVVFVTAHSKYAIEAIKKSAFDYLLKPVDLDELESLVLRLMAETRGENPPESHIRKLKIATRSGYFLIAPEDVVFFEADGNYTKIVQANGEHITSSVHLGKLEDELSEATFCRISRSVIMNIKYLVAVNKGRQECTLKTNHEEFVKHISSKRFGALEAMI